MTTAENAIRYVPLLPPITHEELQRRNMEAVRLLDEWERDGNEQEQRESMEVLLKALGPNREMSYRNAFQ